MKKNFKLFLAAGAVVALASCSNDDTLGGNALVTQDVKGTLTVNVEELMEDSPASTRSAYYYKDASHKNALYFEEGDKINVYDDALTKYDQFVLGADSKFASTTTNVSAHKFAAHPADAWRAEGWTPDGVRAAVKIEKGDATVDPAVYSYAMTTKDQINGQNAFTAIIPMWGTAEDDATTNIKTDLSFLTGILKVTLNGYTSADASWIRVTSGANDPYIAGYFEATLKDGAELKASTTNDAYKAYYGREILIQLPAATVATDYIAYIPIISGVNFKELTVAYAGNKTYTKPKDVTDNNAWVPIYTFTDKTFKRGTAVASMLSVTFVSEASMNTQDVTNALEVNKDGAADLNINTKLNVVFDNSNADKRTIYLPNSSKNITFDFSDFTTSGAGTTKKLEIKEKSGAKFTGSLTFKNNAQDDVNLIINAPNAEKVILDGTFSANTTEITTANFVIGDGNSGSTTTVNADNLTLALTGSIEIANDATTTNTLNLTGAKAQVPLTIGGSAANVKTVKDVNISTVGEDKAITGTLYFEASAKLTLKQGLIAKVDVKQGTANVVTLVNPEGQGIAAIQDVDIHETATFKTEGISKWNGEVISSANASYAQGTNGEIWTASQFATWDGTTDAKLQGNIDLQNNVAYSPKTLNAVAFDGGNFTISNVGNATATNGLFAKVTGTAASISNLKVDGITVTKKTLGTNDAPIGALVGLDDATASTYTNVTLTNINLGNVTDKGQEYAVAIGGLIGKKKQSSSTTTIEKCKVSGSIKGYAWLGGFIGKLAIGNVNFKNSESAVAFTFGKTYVKANDKSLSHVSYEKNAAETEMLKDTWAGTIGTFVGTINTTDCVVAFDSQCKETVALNKSTLKFDNNWKTETTSDKGVTIDQFFHGKTSLVGYCEAFKTVSFFNAQGVQESYDGTVAAEKQAFNLYSQTKN